MIHESHDSRFNFTHMTRDTQYFLEGKMLFTIHAWRRLLSPWRSLYHSLYHSLDYSTSMDRIRYCQWLQHVCSDARPISFCTTFATFTSENHHSWQGAQSKDGIIGRGRFVGLTAMDAGAWLTVSCFPWFRKDEDTPLGLADTVDVAPLRAQVVPSTTRITKRTFTFHDFSIVSVARRSFMTLRCGWGGPWLRWTSTYYIRWSSCWSRFDSCSIGIYNYLQGEDRGQ